MSLQKNWIPAFAGMTERSILRLFTNSSKKTAGFWLEGCLIRLETHIFEWILE